MRIPLESRFIFIIGDRIFQRNLIFEEISSQKYNFVGAISIDKFVYLLLFVEQLQFQIVLVHRTLLCVYVFQHRRRTKY